MIGPPHGSSLIDQFLRDRIVCRADSTRRPTAEEFVDSWRKLNVLGGDIVVVAYPSSWGLLAHVLALVSAGLVPMMVPPALPALRLSELARGVGARAIVQPRIWQSLASMGQVRPLPLGEVLLMEVPRGMTRSGEFVMSTSGTSGASSGCVFDTTSLLANAARHNAAVGIRESDVVLAALPLYYSYAFVAQALSTMLVGARLVVLGSPSTGDGIMAAIKAEGVTATSVTPLLARSLLNCGGRFPTPLRLVTVGGDFMLPRELEQLLRVNPTLGVYLTYGLTEAGPRVSTLAAHDEPAHRHASVGLPLAGTTVGLLNPDPITGEGELLVESNTVMKRRIGRNEDPDRESWAAPGVLRTGDRFALDAAGYLYFRGRSGLFLVRHGEKVNLASVRRVALEIEGVMTARIQLGDAGRFGLELQVRPTLSGDSDGVRRQLVRMLRGVERPDWLTVLPYVESVGSGYK